MHMFITDTNIKVYKRVCTTCMEMYHTVRLFITFLFESI